MNLLSRIAAGATVGAVALGLTAAHNAEPTFATDVAPIFYKNCTTCHHPGGLAPFSLVDLDSAQAYMDVMKDAVASGKMPPWGADGPRGVFKNDPRLAAADRQTIIRWPAAGALPGAMKKLPPRQTPFFIRIRANTLPAEPPRLDTLHQPPRPLGGVIATTAPGTNAMEFPAGTALRLRPGTVLTFEIHYTTHGTAHKDRTSV